MCATVLGAGSGSRNEVRGCRRVDTRLKESSWQQVPSSRRWTSRGPYTERQESFVNDLPTVHLALLTEAGSPMTLGVCQD